MAPRNSRFYLCQRFIFTSSKANSGHESIEIVVIYIDILWFFFYEYMILCNKQEAGAQNVSNEIISADTQA